MLARGRDISRRTCVTRSRASLAVLALLAACSAPAPSLQRDDGLAPRVAGSHRTPANVARDPWRHPLETLEFFGVRETSTVVEILPGNAGYYLEILAPCLREKGRYDAWVTIVAQLAPFDQRTKIGPAQPVELLRQASDEAIESQRLAPLPCSQTNACEPADDQDETEQ